MHASVILINFILSAGLSGESSARRINMLLYCLEEEANEVLTFPKKNGMVLLR